VADPPARVAYLSCTRPAWREGLGQAECRLAPGLLRRNPKPLDFFPPDSHVERWPVLLSG